jgi:lysophospholipid acyltransferase (LPLAT)-like uncharacterized protein
MVQGWQGTSNKQCKQGEAVAITAAAPKLSLGVLSKGMKTFAKLHNCGLGALQL